MTKTQTAIPMKDMSSSGSSSSPNTTAAPLAAAQTNPPQVTVTSANVTSHKKATSMSRGRRIVAPSALYDVSKRKLHQPEVGGAKPQKGKFSFLRRFRKRHQVSSVEPADGGDVTAAAEPVDFWKLYPHQVAKYEQRRHKYASNKIRTTKYTIVSFVPKNLFEQFHR